MNVDFDKLIRLVLPTFLRTGLSDVATAIVWPLKCLFTEFQLWQEDMRLQSSMTCQVMYLELILNYRLCGNFMRTIYITDGDGVTVDFIVNVPRTVTVDGYRLTALLEKYKMAGKRYSIGQFTYNYEISWSDPVCEQHEITVENAWSGFVCELQFHQNAQVYRGPYNPAITAADAIANYNSSRPYYTQLTGAIVGNTLYWDELLQQPVTWQDNIYQSLSADEVNIFWVKLNASGVIVATGT